MNNEIREVLWRITKLPVHPETKAYQIVQTTDNQVEYVENGNEDSNCVKYAFDFVDWSQWPDYRTNSESFIVDTTLIQHLLDGLLMQECGIEAGYYAIYFEQDKIKHIGVAISKTHVRSKWGTLAIFDHPISLTPKNYGEPRFFRPKNNDDLMPAIHDWVNARL